MKKSILIYDAGELICSVMVSTQNSTIGSVEKLRISFQEVEYDIMYVVGMDYAIIIPNLHNVPEISDFTNLH